MQRTLIPVHLRRWLAVFTLCCAALLVRCGGEPSQSLADPSLQLALAPSNPQIAMGTGQQFLLRALLPSGQQTDVTSQATWDIRDEAGLPIAMPQDGFLALAQPGRYAIVAQLGSHKISTQISVTAATLSSVSLSPRTPSVAKGGSLTFTATATFSDGTTQDVSKLASWSIKDVVGVGVATIDTVGVMQARAVGEARVTTKYQTRSSYTTVKITPAKLIKLDLTPPAPSIAAGTSVQFSATGTYSDGTTSNVSAQVNWSIQDLMGTGVASIDGLGSATGLKMGQAQVSAELDAMTAQTVLSVGPGVPVRLTFTKSATSAPRGTKTQFAATAELSDGTQQDVSDLVSWTASDVSGTSVASVSAAGLVTANNVGRSTIQATLRTLSVTSAFEVTPAVLTSILLSPASGTMYTGQTVSFLATGVYSDGTQKLISDSAVWTTQDLIGTAVLSAALGGKITAKSEGKASVTATQGGFSGTAIVEVKKGTIAGLSTSPATTFTFMGLPAKLTATATLMGGGTSDVTNLATWTLDVLAGTAADWTVNKGSVSSKSTGLAVVTATYMGFSGNSTVLSF